MNRFLNILVKVGLGIMLAMVLYYQLWQGGELPRMWASFASSISWEKSWLLVLAAVLMPLNWLLESIKWQRLQKRVAPVGLMQAFCGTLVGVMFTMFTPNRVGDYAGKLLYVNKNKRLATLMTSMLCSFSQLTALLTAGSLGAVLFFYQHQVQFNIPPVMVWAALGVAFMIMFVVGYAYYNVGGLARLLLRWQFMRKYVRDLLILKQFTPGELTTALALSFTRYGVYCFQYYLLLAFFGIGAPPGEALMAIAFLYLLQTGIPLPPISGLAARGGLALAVWSLYPGTELGILSATYSLWLLNVITPALVGAVLLFRLNIVKAIGVGENAAPKAALDKNLHSNIHNSTHHS